MKKIILPLVFTSIVLEVFYGTTYLCSNLNAQVPAKKIQSSVTFDEKKSREALKKEGLSQEAIDTWIEKRKSPAPIEKKTTSQKIQMVQPPVRYPNSCSDMGGENGWSNWSGRAGTININTGAVTWGAWASPPPASNNNTAFTLTTGGGTDACTPAPGNPPLPVVAPGFGTRSIRLGVQVEPNAYAEQISFPLIVTPKDTNFIYTYAIVLDNPADGNHVGIMAPHAEIYILDGTDTVPCSHQLYFGSNDNTLPPGFSVTDCNNGYANAYKPWTTVGVNLNKYVGKTLNVVVSNYDCALTGHFCHSYWDFACPPITGADPPYCQGSQTTLVAPPSDPANPYTYQWYVNGAPYGTPIATSVSITPIPQIGDTFAVHVHQPSGCDFWVPYAPQPMSVNAVFSNAGACGQMTFTNASTASHPNYPITSWNWQFPGGSPSSSTSSTPGIITYPPGTYTATLTVSNALGCTSTITHSFSVGGFPTAAFSSTPTCLGGTTSLTNGSVFPQGDPIVSWNWSMPGGIPSSSTSQSTSTFYNAAGTHSVSLVVTTQTGCRDTIVQQVIVYHPPVANFSGPVSGCAPVCNDYSDLSTCIDGNVVAWQWSFPGGMPTFSSVQNPQDICYSAPGSYGASLIITSSYGCKDTIAITPLVLVYPWPTAEFAVAPSIAPTTAPNFNFSDLWSSGVTHWTWDFGDGSPLDSTNTDPAHSYSAAATANDFYAFNICIRVRNQYGCWDTACHTVELLPEFMFYIPNTFTPNGDNTNEFFFGKSRGVKEYNIWLFDRWGNLVWDCGYKGKNTDWDGPMQDGMSSYCQWNGKVEAGGLDMSGNSKQLAQEDVYVWKVKLIDIFDKKHTYIGHVNIVR